VKASLEGASTLPGLSDEAERTTGMQLGSLFIAAGLDESLRAAAGDAATADEWCGLAERSYVQRLFCDCFRPEADAVELTQPSSRQEDPMLLSETAPGVRQDAIRLARFEQGAEAEGAEASWSANPHWAMFRQPPVFLLPRFVCLPACYSRSQWSGKGRHGDAAVAVDQMEVMVCMRRCLRPHTVLAFLLALLLSLLATAALLGE
jgi:hypothetical protein